MKTTWIVQKNLGATSPTLDALRRACAEAERPIVEVKVIPFSDEMPYIPPVERPFVFYGYTTLITQVYRSEKWREGIYFDPEAFRPERYREHYGDLYLNADMQMATFAKLDAMEFAAETRLFLRPDDDFKRWTGQTMTFAEYQEWFAGFRDMADLPINAQSPLVYAPAKELLFEWRIFLLEGLTIGASLYSPTVSPFVPPEVIEFAESAAELWTPVPVTVMDVAELADGTLRVIELNCFNGSGFYQADVGNIVRCVSRYMESLAAPYCENRP